LLPGASDAGRRPAAVAERSVTRALDRRAGRAHAGRVAGPTPLLSARGITKSFGGRRILDGAVLEIADGDRIGLLGPNGSGKSTLLRALAEVDPPDGGELTRRRGLVVAHLPQ